MKNNGTFFSRFQKPRLYHHISRFFCSKNSYFSSKNTVFCQFFTFFSLFLKKNQFFRKAFYYREFDVFPGVPTKHKFPLLAWGYPSNSLYCQLTKKSDVFSLFFIKITKKHVFKKTENTHSQKHQKTPQKHPKSRVTQGGFRG